MVSSELGLKTGNYEEEYIPHKHQRFWHANGIMREETIFWPKDKKYTNGSSPSFPYDEVVKHTRSFYSDGTLLFESFYNEQGIIKEERQYYPDGQIQQIDKYAGRATIEFSERYLGDGTLDSLASHGKIYKILLHLNIVEKTNGLFNITTLYRYPAGQTPKTIEEIEKLKNIMDAPNFNMGMYKVFKNANVFKNDDGSIKYVAAFSDNFGFLDFVWNYKLNRIEEYNSRSHTPENLIAVYPFVDGKAPQDILDIQNLTRQSVQEYDTFNQSQEAADLPFEDDEYLSPDAVKDVDGWLQWNDEYQNKLNSYKNEREIFKAIRSLGGIRYADLVDLLGEDLARDLRSLFPTLLRTQKGKEQLPLDFLLQNLNEQIELSAPQFEYADDFIDWLYKTAERRPKRPAPIVEINSETEDVLINRLGLDGAREYAKIRRTYLNDMQKRVFAEYELDKSNEQAKNDLKNIFYEQKEIEKFLSELKEIETQAKREVEDERRANITDEERDMEDAYWGIWDEMKREKAANTRRENLHDSTKRESIPIDEAFKRGYAMAERYSKEAYEAGFREGRAQQKEVTKQRLEQQLERVRANRDELKKRQRARAAMTVYDMAQQITSGEWNEVKQTLSTISALVCTAMLTGLMRGDLPYGEDDEGDEEKLMAWAGRLFSAQFIESIPLIGREGMVAYDELVRHKWRGTQYSSTVAPLIKIAKAYDLWRDEDSEEEEIRHAIQLFIEGFSLAGVPFSVPVTGIRRIFEAYDLKDENGLAAALNILGIKIEED